MAIHEGTVPATPRPIRPSLEVVSASPLAVVPLKSWRLAKGRLEPVLGDEERAALAEESAGRVVSSLAAAGFEVAVVAAEGDVIAWAKREGIGVVADPGTGLDGAAHAAVVAAGERPWCIAHGDLPLFNSEDAVLILDTLARGKTVLCPSRDGGTNLIASTGPFDFSFGPSSFHRHLARASEPTSVIVTAGTAVEIDTPLDLNQVTALPSASWLQRYRI